MKRSPLAPASFPNLPTIDGLSLAVARSTTKYKDRDDLFLITLCDSATTAGVFTRSDTAAAPVVWSRNRISSGDIRAIFTNAGNANAFNGQVGQDTVCTITSALGQSLGITPDQILLASTGVIGEPLDAKMLSVHFPELIANKNASWEQAASAISTTDTFSKGAYLQCQIGDTPVNICGIAKGSGMIAPNMATMLAYVATDATLQTDLLQKLLNISVNQSFNSITVDSDTSTNDSVFLMATGHARHPLITDVNDPRLAEFCCTLKQLMVDLAKQIVRDGEGASKLVTISVSGAKTEDQARQIGLAIANSPLVKTAIAGEDANWGRIVMALGKYGFGVDQNIIGIKIGGFPVAADGMRVSNYDEELIANHLKTTSIDIAVAVGSGTGKAQIYTCDLTHGYISINADYRS